MEKLIILIILFGISAVLYTLYLHNKAKMLIWQKAMGWDLDASKKDEGKKEEEHTQEKT